MLYEMGLVCGITVHTRLELNNDKLSKSCIDHIFARSRSQDLFTAALGTTLADHRAVILACIVFIDYSKAFDTLCHERLLECLHDSGIRGNLLDWCSDYLNDRRYTVRVCNATSDIVIATEGTAQGSVIGPLHYLTYVNSLTNVIKHSETYQFADDTCLVAAGSEPQKEKKRNPYTQTITLLSICLSGQISDIEGSVRESV
ncbi:uncharacterized protein LOC123705990 [Colias croceus]|uniref:uncharacterized protein LOC123705990 n=1 Tax=Colias crocea TaxID=72248 RepID=UPI001E27D604|nr:uncharacterized protein LOC123705990 [Colias croceus]